MIKAKKRVITSLMATVAVLVFACTSASVPSSTQEQATNSAKQASDTTTQRAAATDTAATQATANGDLTQADFPDSSADRYTRLTELDYDKVAKELGVEIAAIKALAAVEANGRGFTSAGQPVINFDLSVFKQLLRRNGYNVAKARKTAPIAFARPNSRRYGGYVAAQHARLNNACKVSRNVALQSTFWGMFQIGGFNYKRCDCKSVDEMVQLMSQSEAMQLELFARFIRNSNYVHYIKRHDWRGFSRAYNGGRTAKGHAARLARAYRKYKNQ